MGGSEAGPKAGGADQEPPKAEAPPERVSSLHDLIEDDPYLTEPFWPPILMGLGLVVVISIAILWRHGVIG